MLVASSKLSQEMAKMSKYSPVKSNREKHSDKVNISPIQRKEFALCRCQQKTVAHMLVAIELRLKV